VPEFSREELKALVQEEIPPCVSIYVPSTLREGQLWQEPIYLKNALQEAEQRMLAMDMRRPDVEAMLAPARGLLNDGSFWAIPHQGLALFVSMSPSAYRYYTDDSIAIEFEPTVVVGNHFYVTPLLPLLTGDGQFYVLALSQNHVGLLKGTRDTIQPVSTSGVPENIHEALGEEIPEREIQGRPMNVAGGEQTGVFGGFDPGDYEKDRVQRFCRTIANRLRAFLADQHAPLVIAGQDYLHPIYREANTYPHLLEKGITVNADTLTAEELHKSAWAIVEPYFHKEMEDAIERYRQYSNTEQVSSKLADIIPAAHFGRVATLFVAEGKHQYGMFDPDTMRLEVHRESHFDNVDLIDEAATQTVLNGGVVYIIREANMPARHAEIAAIYRY
jgi:hypothetical protein